MIQTETNGKFVSANILFDILSTKTIVMSCQIINKPDLLLCGMNGDNQKSEYPNDHLWLMLTNFRPPQ